MTHRNPPTFSEWLSDRIAEIVGSWPFIVIQLLVLIAWMSVNVILPAFAWDPYPYILLNLALSFQAAFTAPIIMMSQNRQSIIDRKKTHDDYAVNVKAEKEIKKLHEKIDNLMDKIENKDEEIKVLMEIITNKQP
jgi:uncharacterized membrane protein